MGNDIADIYNETTNRVLMLLAEKQIRIAFEQAQKEIDHLHVRTKEGIEKARQQGRIPGRRSGCRIETMKAKEAKQTILKHNKNFGGSLTNEETWKLAGISKMTFYKYKKNCRIDPIISSCWIVMLLSMHQFRQLLINMISSSLGNK